MKQLKSFLYTLFTVMGLAFVACSNDDPNPLAASTGEVEITPATLTFTADGGEGTFTVAGGVPFVRSEAEWLTVALGSSTKASATYTVTCSENTGTEAREGKILVNLDGAYTRLVVTQAAEEAVPPVGQDFRTAAELAKVMSPGWNLGNTLEATGGETSWQPTQTTQEIINYVKAQGFKSVRIPCSWDIHATDGTIDATWMARVKEVVDYCINAGLYVVLNDHYDGGWLEVLGFSMSADSYQKADDATVTAKTTQLKNYWTQIANAFASYGDHLLFAGLNEPFQNYTLFNGETKHKELTPILHTYNQAFVDAVRATGGNNAKRTLVVQTPSTSISSATNANIGFQMPTDIQTGYLMAEAHYYEPWDFCGGEDGTVCYWGEGNHHTSANPTFGEESWIAEQFGKMKTAFADKGYPVILGEYGANWRDLSAVEGASQEKHDASIKAFFKEVNRQAVNHGIIPFAWDINSTNRNGLKGTMTIISRSALSIYCTPAMEGITEGIAAGQYPY